MWSAVSLAEDSTFFSESLNPFRVVPMSPVFQVPMALLFKLAGVSFGLARGMSWAYMAVAYLGVLVLVARRPWPFIAAGVASLFFLGASTVVAANMVRPEAMVWALAVWACVCTDRGRSWSALAISGIGALIHPVGVIFFAGVLMLVMLDGWPRRRVLPPQGWDWPILITALAVLAGHLWFVCLNWGAVAADSQAAANDLHGGILQRIFASNKTIWLALYGALAGASVWRLRELRVPVILGGCALATMVVRPQMWYEIYNQMGFMWLTLAVSWTLHGIAAWICSSHSGPRAVPIRALVPALAFGLGLLPMLRFCQLNGFITGFHNYPAKLAWGWGMQMDPQPYMTAADIRAVVLEVERHVADGQKHRVFFMPEADAFFYREYLPTNVIAYQGVWTEEQADLAVFRLSRHPPRWWTDQYVMSHLQRYGGEGIAPFYERDGTEKWILVPRR